MRPKPTFQSVWDKIHNSGESHRAHISGNSPKRRIWRDSYGFTHIVTYTANGVPTHKNVQTTQRSTKCMKSANGTI